jgi:hypothetical protein
MNTPTTSIIEYDDDNVQQLNARFCASIIKQKSLFQSLPFSLRAQLSKNWTDLSDGKNLQSDCCKFCGLQISSENSKIHLRKRRRKQR